MVSIILGGNAAESIGRVVGYSKFKAANGTFFQKLDVLRENIDGVILGIRFLD